MAEESREKSAGSALSEGENLTELQELKEENPEKLNRYFSKLPRSVGEAPENSPSATVGPKDPVAKYGMSDILQEDEILEILRVSLKREFRVINLSVRPASENPAGFLGEHYRMEAEVAVDGRLKKLNYFIKGIPRGVPQHRDYALKTRAFYKEVELYKTLFADLKNVQKDLPNPTKWCPEYFYSRGSELFVLEDLTSEGYYMYPERSYVDEEHVKASLKAMAAMHAASLVFEEKFRRGEAALSISAPPAADGEATVGQIYAHLTFETEASDERGHPGNTYHEAGLGGLLKIVEFLSGYSDREKRFVQEKLPEVTRRYFQLVKTSHRFKNVFLHGDLWANNILFRKDKTGKVSNALIIDFQLARYAPPAHDVMMFLHLVQSKEFREEHLGRLLGCYYEAFAKELEKNALKVEILLPWDAFLESCDFYDDLGLICKLFYFQLILAPPEIMSKFLSSPDIFTKNMLEDRTEMVVECFLKDEICRSRMTEALNDVIKKFILRPPA